MSPSVSDQRYMATATGPLPEEHVIIGHGLPQNIPSPYTQHARRTPGPQYMTPEHSATYSSPEPNHWMHDGFANDEHPNSYPYAYPNPEFIGNSPYHTYSRGTPASDRSDFSMSNPGYQQRSTWTRPQNTTKPKPKKKKKKGDDNGKSDLPSGQPVSILSKDSDGPAQDIERFVNRSTETRHKEVEGKNGYRPRPMNNFMLYRKAYQERAKQVSSQNNHQVVSVIVAASWKNEAVEVKDRFAKYAQIEKDNHILAFPDYQFRPNKSQKSKKRKIELETDEEPWTDLDDPNDPDWGRSSSKRARVRQSRQIVYGQDYGFQTDYGQHTYTLPYHSNTNVYGTANLSKPPPVQAQESNHSAYYDQILPDPYANTGTLQFDDNQWASFAAQDTRTMPVQAQVSGLPGAGQALLDAADDFGPSTQFGTDNASLDPLLVNEDHGANGAFTQSEFENLGSIDLDGTWDDHKPSLSAVVATGSQNGGVPYDDEQFAQFLKSS